MAVVTSFGGESGQSAGDYRRHGILNVVCQRPDVAVFAGAVGVQPGICDGAVAAVEVACGGLCDRFDGHIAAVSHDGRDEGGHVGVGDALDVCGAVCGQVKVGGCHVVDKVPVVSLAVDGVLVGQGGVAASVGECRGGGDVLELDQRAADVSCRRRWVADLAHTGYEAGAVGDLVEGFRADVVGVVPDERLSAEGVGVGVGDVAGVGLVHGGGALNTDDGGLAAATVHDDGRGDGVVGGVGEAGDVDRVIDGSGNRLYVNVVGKRPGGVLAVAVLVAEGEGFRPGAVADVVGECRAGGCDHIAAGVGHDGECDVLGRGLFLAVDGGGNVRLANGEGSGPVNGDVLCDVGGVAAVVGDGVGTENLDGASFGDDLVGVVQGEFFHGCAVVGDGHALHAVDDGGGGVCGRRVIGTTA